jgi:hypothetical protein
MLVAVARLDAIQEKAERLSALIDAPRQDLPTYGDRGHSGRPHAEVTPGFGRRDREFCLARKPVL